MRAPTANTLSSTIVKVSERPRIGARTFANFGLVALDVAPITIGDDVQIGPRVQLLTPTHPLQAEARRTKWEAAALKKATVRFIIALGAINRNQMAHVPRAGRRM